MTHTLAAVVVIALAVAAAGGIAGARRATVLRAAGWAAAVYASHLVLDYVTVCAVPPSGGRFLWPLSDAHYIAPRPLLDEIIIDSSSRSAFVASLLTPHALGVWARELAFLLGIVGLVHGLRRSAPAAETAPCSEVGGGRCGARRARARRPPRPPKPRFGRARLLRRPA